MHDLMARKLGVDMAYGLTDLQRSDVAWFREHITDLFFRYGNKYVAISNETVLGAFDTSAEAVDEARRFHRRGEYIVQRLGLDESAYTVDRQLLFG